MKKTFSILALTILLVSCSKDDAPTPILIPVPTTKVIDKIETKTTYSGNTTVLNNKITFEYNANKEISKIATFRNGNLNYSYTYVYQNNIPVSSMYDFPAGGSAAYQVTYGYTNGRYSSYFDSRFNDTTNFAYNTQFNQYTNSINGNRFILDSNFDIVILANSGYEYIFNFDNTKKGPLHNVVNKKWIQSLWYGISDLNIVEISTYPITSITDGNSTEISNFTNIYDSDGFITKSNFTVNNGNEIFEITYTYKSI